MNNTPIHPAAQIGHVHLWVTDLDRAIGFYSEVLGLQVTRHMRKEPIPCRRRLPSSGWLTRAQDPGIERDHGPLPLRLTLPESAGAGKSPTASPRPGVSR